MGGERFAGPAVGGTSGKADPSSVTEAGTALALQLPGGIRMEVADEKQAVLAAVLVRALAKSC